MTTKKGALPKGRPNKHRICISPRMLGRGTSRHRPIVSRRGVPDVVRYSIASLRSLQLAPTVST